MIILLLYLFWAVSVAAFVVWGLTWLSWGVLLGLGAPFVFLLWRATASHWRSRRRRKHRRQAAQDSFRVGYQVGEQLCLDLANGPIPFLREHKLDPVEYMYDPAGTCWPLTPSMEVLVSQDPERAQWLDPAAMRAGFTSAFSDHLYGASDMSGGGAGR